MENFRTYLRDKGLSHLKGEERKNAYTVYKREYVRAYMQRKRNGHQVIELYFNPSQYERLSKTALQYGLSRSGYCQQIVLSKISDKIWIPNQEIISELQVSIRKIGNNLNQIARIANSQKSASPQLWEETYQKLNQLELLIEETLSRPELFTET